MFALTHPVMLSLTLSRGVSLLTFTLHSVLWVTLLGPSHTPHGLVAHAVFLLLAGWQRTTRTAITSATRSRNSCTHPPLTFPCSAPSVVAWFMSRNCHLVWDTPVVWIMAPQPWNHGVKISWRHQSMVFRGPHYSERNFIPAAIDVAIFF